MRKVRRRQRACVRAAWMRAGRECARCARAPSPRRHAAARAYAAAAPYPHTIPPQLHLVDLWREEKTDIKAAKKGKKTEIKAHNTECELCGDSGVML